jgi:hypothetical protein
MRTDPTDTGGLFVSRRPGTRPIRYRALPQRGDEKRRRLDEALAAGFLAVMVVISLAFWGPLPLACLWIGGHAQWLTDSVGIGILASFTTLGAGLLLGLMMLKRLDFAWILVRRAAGHDQREGVIGRIFMLCCMVGVPAFGIWFLFFSGASLSGLSVQDFLGG